MYAGVGGGGFVGEFLCFISDEKTEGSNERGADAGKEARGLLCSFPLEKQQPRKLNSTEKRERETPQLGTSK